MFTLLLLNVTMTANTPQMNTMTTFMLGFSSVFDAYGPQLCGRNEKRELGTLLVNAPPQFLLLLRKVVTSTSAKLSIISSPQSSSSLPQVKSLLQGFLVYLVMLVPYFGIMSSLRLIPVTADDVEVQEIAIYFVKLTFFAG